MISTQDKLKAGIGAVVIFATVAGITHAVSSAQNCVPQDHIDPKAFAYMPQSLIFTAVGFKGKGNCLAGWQPK